jgi:hypothetical protein
MGTTPAVSSVSVSSRVACANAGSKSFDVTTLLPACHLEHPVSHSFMTCLTCSQPTTPQRLGVKLV